MKIELTLDVNYVSNWDAWMAIRELVANARDAELESNAPMTIDWYADKLRIENDGVILDKEDLLLGRSSKRGRSDLIGKFGEGMKLGVLALCRAGHSVKIRNGSEVWLARIARSEKFNADVLTFQIQEGRENNQRIRFEIGGISKDDWLSMKDRFLFLQKPAEDKKIDTAYGTLLLGEPMRGKIFVKGVYIRYDAKLVYGYNFYDMEINRDRDFVNSWDCEQLTKQILNEAVSSRPDLFGSVYTLLEDAAADVQGIWDGNAFHLSDNLKQNVADEFKRRFGADAIPVANLSESKDIEHFGKQGIIVSKPLKAVLRETVGDFEKVKKELEKAVQRKYAWYELDPDEQANFTAAMDLLNRAIQAPVDLVDIADFRSDLFGLFEGGKVLVSRKILRSKAKLLMTLIHEFAHRDGGDGDKAHIATEEVSMEKVLEILWS